MRMTGLESVVEVDAEECKGCALCVDTCPERVLTLSILLNRSGYHPVEYAGSGCTGCGLCFFCCPEPSAIRVLPVAAAVGWG